MIINILLYNYIMEYYLIMPNYDVQTDIFIHKERWQQ